MSKRASSILVDSNLLLLLAVGLWNPRAISSQKRLNNLAAADFELLRDFISSFETVVTTPHVLTEVSNLAGSASGQSRFGIFAQLSSLLKVLDEKTITAVSCADELEFRVFGLTDAILSRLSSETLLITQDGRLASHLQRKGLMVMTLQDLRNRRNRSNHG